MCYVYSQWYDISCATLYLKHLITYRDYWHIGHNMIETCDWSQGCVQNITYLRYLNWYEENFFECTTYFQTVR